MTAHVRQQSQGVSQLLCNLQLVSGCKKLAKEENIPEVLALPLRGSPGCTFSKVSQYSTTERAVPCCRKQQCPSPPATWSCTSRTGTGGYPTSHKVQLVKISHSAFHFSLFGKGGFWPVQLPQLTYPQGRWIFKWLMAIKFNSIRNWLRQK